MNCVVCNSQNPEGAKYCATCGTRLDLNSGPLKEVLEASVRREVDSALQRYLKDQKITEFDITEKVTNRLLGWAKILVTILGALAVVAGLLGVKSVVDLYRLTRKEVVASVESAKKGIEKQKQELSKLTSDNGKLHDRYSELYSKLPEYQKIADSALAVKANLDKSLAQQNDKIEQLNQQVQNLVARIGGTDILAIGSAITFESGMVIDADGAYHAYHPDNKSGLEFLFNAGHPGNWFGLVTDNGTVTGTPVIQTANDPAPGFYVSFTALQDPSRDRKDPLRYVNAEAVNYIVIPGRLNVKINDQSVKPGDFAAVIRPDIGACAYAVVADIGPPNHIGEGSIALAKALGIPSDIKPRDSKPPGIALGIIYIVFPGSAQGWPLSQKEIDQKGAALFSKWGGIDKAKNAFPKLTWR